MGYSASLVVVTRSRSTSSKFRFGRSGLSDMPKTGLIASADADRKVVFGFASRTRGTMAGLGYCSVKLSVV